MTLEIVQRLAERNKVPVPENALGWKDDGSAKGALGAFLKSYDAATSVLKRAEDYSDITYDYLQRSAEEGCIYAEISISAGHGAIAGLSYPDMVDAISKGYERAKKETGIEMRLIATCVRHYGAKAALEAAKTTRDLAHPLVTGFGMAGDENAGTPEDFRPAFELSGLKNRTAHAGEAAGPESVRAARETLNVRRFGHMVRAIEDPALMEELRSINAVPEVCVSSNLCLKVFQNQKSHPLRKFFNFGLKVTLGSDDPSFFGTSIGNEYRIAEERFGFSEDELRRLSQNAAEEAFIEDGLRERLLKSLND